MLSGVSWSGCLEGLLNCFAATRYEAGSAVGGKEPTARWGGSVTWCSVMVSEVVGYDKDPRAD